MLGQGDGDMRFSPRPGLQELISHETKGHD